MYENDIAYELPIDTGALVAIVDSIPSNWSYLNGSLNAPRDLYTPGQVVERTNLILNEEGRISQISASGKNLNDLIIKKKSPAIISFNHAQDQMDTSGEPIAYTKQIAAHFIEWGYWGGFMAVKGNNDAQAVIDIPKHATKHGKIELCFDAPTGSKEDLTSIVEVCEQLGLRKVPTSTAHLQKNK